MIRATSIVRRPAVKPDRVADTVVLPHAARQGGAGALRGEGGLEFLLDLARGGPIEDGDALKLEDGRLVQVKAAPEKLVAVTTDNPTRLIKVALHLGNLHVPTEIAPDALYIAADSGLLDVVRGLGAAARAVERPFRPERGADAGHVHGPDCGHGHGHDHAPHGHGDDHDHAHDNSHAHGAAYGCGHDHGPSSQHDHGQAPDAHGTHPRTTTEPGGS
jgi:urease accessory protein